MTTKGEGEGGGAGGGQQPDLEGMARRGGWKPQEEFVAAGGKAEKWKPAADYITAMMENPGILSERYRTLDKRFEQSEQQIGKVSKTLEETLDVLSTFKDRYERVEQTAYERARAELIAERDQAFDNADKQAGLEAIRKLDELEKTKPAAEKPAGEKKKPAAEAESGAAGADQSQQQQKPQVHPDVEAWHEKNPWYKPTGTDPMTLLAVGAYNESHQANPGAPVKTHLEAAEREVRKRYPEKFTNQRREAPAAVSEPSGGGAGGGGGQKGRSFDDLPKAAQEECRRYEATMVKDKTGKSVPLLTREKYLADYQWPE
jgi:hypothetical protein